MMPYIANGHYPLPHLPIFDENGNGRIKEIVDWGSLNLSSCLQVFMLNNVLFSAFWFRFSLDPVFSRWVLRECFYGQTMQRVGLIQNFKA